MIRDLTLVLKNERMSKKGSCLSATEVAAFPIRLIPSSQLEHSVSHIDEDSAEFKAVFDLLTSYTGLMITLHRQKSTAEVEYVHQPTFRFLKDISNALLPEEYINEMEFCEKAPEKSISIKYSTELEIQGKFLDISGEADFCMKFCEVPLFVLEAKNLLETCDTPKEKAEVLVETKGFAEEFCKKMTAAPLEFPGLLVSGKLFVFVRRNVAEDGEAVYLLSKPIATFDGSYSIHEGNMKLVSREIVCMFRTIRGLIQAVTQKNQEPRFGRVGELMVSTFDDDRNSDGKGDKENNDNDGQGEHGNKNQGTGHSSGRSSFQTSSNTTKGSGWDASQRCSITGTKKAFTLTERNLQKHDQRFFFM